MFDLFNSKKEEIIEEKSTNNVIRIESDNEVLRKSRNVFRGKRMIGNISYENEEWVFRGHVNIGSYFSFAEFANEAELQIILDEIKNLNLIHG